MGDTSLEKLVTRDLKLEHAVKEVEHPVLLYQTEAQNFTISWWAVSQPFVMEAETFYHDFDQYLYFIGGDVTNMLELGGEVEFFMGEDLERLQKFVINSPTVIHVPRGLLHSPLRFKKVDNPNKPIFFQDMSMTTRYRKFFPGGTVPYDQHNQPLE